MPTPTFFDISPVESVEALWGLPLTAAGCAVCGQANLIEDKRPGERCPTCARGQLTAQPARVRPEPPELTLPFRTSRTDLLVVLNNFVKGVWLRPDDFNPATLLQRARPVYWPMWLVDSDVAGDWQAEAGFDYQVKSSQEAYTDGNWQTREVVETRIRWEPRTGQIRRHYDNIAVPAASDHQKLSGLIGGYAFDQVVAYDRAQIAGAALRVPDLQPENAWPLAQTQLDNAAAADCQKAAGAQHTRNFAIRAAYEALHWTQLLLPLYVTYYTDDQGQAHPVYINGQTGAIGGRRMASQRKGWVWAGAVAAIAVVICVLSLLALAMGLAFPPLLLLGGLMLVVGLVVGGCALIPALWPWQWNQKQR